MGPLFFSDNEDETSDVPSPPPAPPSKTRRRDHESPKSPVLNPTKRRSSTDLSTTKETTTTDQPPTDEKLTKIPDSVQAYIKELENYRDMDKGKHDDAQGGRASQIKELEEKCAELEGLARATAQRANNERSDLVQQFTSRISQLEAAVRAKEQEVRSVVEQADAYRNTLLNVLPPLVEEDEAKDAKIERLERVEAQNAELQAEITRYRERNIQLIDENRRLQRFKQAVNEAVAKVDERA